MNTLPQFLISCNNKKRTYWWTSDHNIWVEVSSSMACYYSTPADSTNQAFILTGCSENACVCECAGYG